VRAGFRCFEQTIAAKIEEQEMSGVEGSAIGPSLDMKIFEQVSNMTGATYGHRLGRLEAMGMGESRLV
jgi:hypothetical protein